MRKLLSISLIAAVLVANFPFQAIAAQEKQYPAKFEILGMLKEYMFRSTDLNTVESFYPDEVSVASHFETLLPAFCAEEGIDAKFEKQIRPEGHIYFISPIIAKAINQYYTKGLLSASVFDNASKNDLLCYALGAYIRSGDKNKAALIYGANCYSKLHLLGIVLSKLGCSNIRLYSSGDNAVPTSFVLLFSPTTAVKQKLGIKKEATMDDLKEYGGSMLQLDQKIRLN